MPPEPEGDTIASLLSTAPDAATAAAATGGGGDLVFQLLLLVVLIFFNAFFAMSEIAIITLNDSKLRKMAEDGHKGAKKVLRLTKNSSNFLATIQVGVTLSGFLTSASAAQSFSGQLAQLLSFIPLSRSVLEGISTVLITLVLSYFSLVLGELVPKRIAMQRAESISFKVAGVLLGIAKVCSPFIRLLSASTNGVLRLLGFDPNASQEEVTEEEILMMVDAGEEKGVIEGSAKNMIANVFEFDDTVVSELMTHRTEMEAVEDTAPIQDAVDLAIQYGYSRIPVYHEDIDDIVGIVYVKDLLKYVCAEMPAEVKLTDVMRTANFVPETKRCSELFAEMTASKVQIAIVVDEYGGTEGLITMEDLVEAIVGNIQDEYDNEEEEIKQVGDNIFTVEGSTPIDEISDLTGVDMPEGDYDTLAGFIVETLGRIPKSGEHPSVTVGNVQFTVAQVEDRRVAKVTVVRPPKEEKSEESSEEKGKQGADATDASEKKEKPSKASKQHDSEDGE
ncbi:MAG TPA: HlyC/CorC family transporter [Candidatus Gallacutalibacter stercoravium]|nr:HlyC/CorC family transporter [Candidatus Gallacutalibacter stercoravium]